VLKKTEASRSEVGRVIISGCGEDGRNWRVCARMMQRVLGRVLQAVGGRDPGFVRGRGPLAHLLPPVAVVGEVPSVITARNGAGRRWGGALVRRRDAHHGGVLPGFGRGFAAGYGGTRSGGGGGGRGRGGGGGGPRSGGGGRGRGGPVAGQPQPRRAG